MTRLQVGHRILLLIASVALLLLGCDIAVRTRPDPGALIVAERVELAVGLVLDQAQLKQNYLWGLTTRKYDIRSGEAMGAAALSMCNRMFSRTESLGSRLEAEGKELALVVLPVLMKFEYSTGVDLQASVEVRCIVIDRNGVVVLDDTVKALSTKQEGAGLLGYRLDVGPKLFARVTSEVFTSAFTELAGRIVAKVDFDKYRRN